MFIDQLTNPISLVGHINYILVILSVSMSSMRWLRIFGIASGVVGVLYYGFLVSDEISATWEFIFALVNAVQLAIVLVAGRRRRMDQDEKLLQAHLPAIARRSRQQELTHPGSNEREMRGSSVRVYLNCRSLPLMLGPPVMGEKGNP